MSMSYNQKGRSMVEMLGVLAIIGILSVGGIAGYQKAMFKYKLNKHAEGFNILLGNAIEYREKLGMETTGSWSASYYADFFEKANLLPDNIKKINAFYLQETYFSSKLWIYTYPHVDWLGIGIRLQQGSDDREVCKNFVQTAKENHQNIYAVQWQEEKIGEGVYSNDYYGDQFCGKDKKCLHSLTLQDLDSLCGTCADKTECTLYISIP